MTAAGRDLVERARAILRTADELVESARRFSDPLAGTLRIGVIPTISPYLLPDLTPAIRSAYPNLTVRWIEDKTNALVRHLNAGTLDAALLALEAEIGDVEREVIAKDRFVLVAAKGDALARNTAPAKASELRDASVLLLDEEHCFGKQALAFCSTAKARDLEFRATSLSTIAHMVLGGAGVTCFLSFPYRRKPGFQVCACVPLPSPRRAGLSAWCGASARRSRRHCAKRRRPCGALIRPHARPRQLNCGRCREPDKAIGVPPKVFACIIMAEARVPSNFKEPNAIDRIINRAFGFLLKLGMGLAHNYLLEVRGRKTGRTYATPVNVLEHEGRRYLVAPRGYTQWVRNAEASGEATLVRGATRERVKLRAVPDEAKAELLKIYLDRFKPTVQRYFPIPAGSPAKAFEPVAVRYPVFELNRYE